LGGTKGKASGTPTEGLLWQKCVALQGGGEVMGEEKSRCKFILQKKKGRIQKKKMNYAVRIPYKKKARPIP